MDVKPDLRFAIVIHKLSACLVDEAIKALVSHTSIPKESFQFLLSDHWGVKLILDDESKFRRAVFAKSVAVGNSNYFIYPLITDLTIHGAGLYIDHLRLKTQLEFLFGRVFLVYREKDQSKGTLTNNFRAAVDHPEIVEFIKHWKSIELVIPGKEAVNFPITSFCRFCRADGHTRHECCQMFEDGETSRNRTQLESPSCEDTTLLQPFKRILSPIKSANTSTSNVIKTSVVGRVTQSPENTGTGNEVGAKSCLKTNQNLQKYLKSLITDQQELAVKRRNKETSSREVPKVLRTSQIRPTIERNRSPSQISVTTLRGKYAAKTKGNIEPCKGEESCRPRMQDKPKFGNKNGKKVQSNFRIDERNAQNSGKKDNRNALLGKPQHVRETLKNQTEKRPNTKNESNSESCNNRHKKEHADSKTSKTNEMNLWDKIRNREKLLRNEMYDGNVPKKWKSKIQNSSSTTLSPSKYSNNHETVSEITQTSYFTHSEYGYIKNKINEFSFDVPEKKIKIEKRDSTESNLSDHLRKSPLKLEETKSTLVKQKKQNITDSQCVQVVFDSRRNKINAFSFDAPVNKIKIERKDSSDSHLGDCVQKLPVKKIKLEKSDSSESNLSGCLPLKSGETESTLVKQRIKNITESQSGQVVFDSRRNKINTFSFDFPVKKVKIERTDSSDSHLGDSELKPPGKTEEAKSTLSTQRNQSITDSLNEISRQLVHKCLEEMKESQINVQTDNNKCDSLKIGCSHPIKTEIVGYFSSPSSSIKFIEGVLTRHELDAFLVHVKGHKHPRWLASQYSTDIGGIMTQIQEITKTYLLELKRTREGDCMVRRLRYLADKLELHADCKVCSCTANP